jgi:hypothetical protein
MNDLLDGGSPRRLSPTMSSRRLLVLAFVRDYIIANRGSPSLREIANALETNPVRIKRAIDKLVAQGELMRAPGPRGLRLPTMLDTAKRQLREAGWIVDEDVHRIGQCVTQSQLPAPPDLTYRRAGSGDGNGIGGASGVRGGARRG